MILEETVNRLLRDSINLILGTPEFAVRGRQDAPQPDNPYAIVNFIDETPIGTEQRTYTPYQSILIDPVTHNGEQVTHYGEDMVHTLSFEDVQEDLKGLRSMQFSINIHGTGAFDYARQTHMGFIRQSIQDLFLTAKIGLTSRSDVRDLSFAEVEGWDPRAEFDIVLNMVGTDQDIIRAIHSVDIAGEYQIRNMAYNFNIQANV